MELKSESDFCTKHWNVKYNMPQCMIGGNVCDDCWAGKRRWADYIFTWQLVADGIIKIVPDNYKKKEKEEAPLPDVVVDKFQGYESLYELTLTTTKDDPYELREWLTKIANSNMYMTIGYIYCIELTKAGLPHIHALLFSSNKYCDGTKIKKSLKYPYRYEMKRVKLPGNYYTYINKESENQLVIDYCLKKGIPQFEELIMGKK